MLGILRDNYEVLLEYLRNNDEEEEFFNDIIKSFLKNYRKIIDYKNMMDRGQEKLLDKFDQVSEVYFENKKNYRVLKTKLIDLEDESQNPFIEKSYTDRRDSSFRSKSDLEEKSVEAQKEQLRKKQSRKFQEEDESEGEELKQEI